jgi:hypothetical protein
MTYDYKRNGTIDLFAAMNLATGEVLTDLQQRHAATDALRFSKQIDAAVPRGLAGPRRAGQPVRTQPPADHQSGWPTATGAAGICISPDLQLVAESGRALVQELTDNRLRRGRFTRSATSPRRSPPADGTSTPKLHLEGHGLRDHREWSNAAGKPSTRSLTD